MCKRACKFLEVHFINHLATPPRVCLETSDRLVHWRYQQILDLGVEITAAFALFFLFAFQHNSCNFVQITEIVSKQLNFLASQNFVEGDTVVTQKCTCSHQKFAVNQSSASAFPLAHHQCPASRHVTTLPHPDTLGVGRLLFCACI